MPNDLPFRRTPSSGRRFRLLLLLHWVPLTAMAASAIACLLIAIWAVVPEAPTEKVKTPASGPASLPGSASTPLSPSPFWLAISSVAASLSASSVWFGLAYLYSRGFMRTVQEYPALDSFPIESFIRASARIEVNVHGWDGLFVGRGGNVAQPLSTKRGKVWEKFFKDNGTLVLMLPKLPHNTANYEERMKLEQALTVVGHRNGKSLPEQIDEIESTLRVAHAIRGNSGVVDTRDCNQLRWICTIKFDDHSLLVSPYTQRDPSAPFEAPVFLINLHAYENTRAWVDVIHGRED